MKYPYLHLTVVLKQIVEFLVEAMYYLPEILEIFHKRQRLVVCYIFFKYYNHSDNS